MPAFCAALARALGSCSCSRLCSRALLSRPVGSKSNRRPLDYKHSSLSTRTQLPQVPIFQFLKTAHVYNVYSFSRICLKFDANSFCSFVLQGSGHNESSNHSLCSVGSLSDKELEVSVLRILNMADMVCFFYLAEHLLGQFDLLLQFDRSCMEKVNCSVLFACTLPHSLGFGTA